MAEARVWQKTVSGVLFQGVFLSCLLSPSTAAAQAKPPAVPNEVPKYVGPGSCAASACHGGVEARSVSSVLQNEYSTWVVRDAHFKAFRNLDSPIAQRMGRLLGIDKPSASPKCLACHSLAVAPEKKARDFDLEGVSCESCHGPASAWLVSHTLKGATTQQSIARGMFDIRDPVHRSENCLGCHLGTAEHDVDHRMIAAGHPDLVFELDSYSAIEPAHWKPAPDPYHDVRLWAVGQAIQLRESLKKLARHTRGESWPEFSDYDCFSCHHSLTTPENSWRQERGYEHRAPGSPAWDTAHYTVFRILAKEVDPALTQQLDAEIQRVYEAASDWNGARNEISEKASAASETANRLVAEVKQASFDQARAIGLLDAISSEADAIANQDTRSAEQATMALDTIFLSYEKQAGSHPAVRSAIDALFKEVNDPSAYSAPRFSGQMRKLNAALRDSGISTH
jgi:hypothetical protein